MKALEQLEGIFEFEGIRVDGTIAEKGRVTLFLGESEANTYEDAADLLSAVEAVLGGRYKYWDGDCRYLPTRSDLELIIAQEKEAQKLAAVGSLPGYPVDPVKYIDSYSATANKREDYGLDYFGRKCIRKYGLEAFVSEGGDSIRDASAGKVYFGKDLKSGSWRLV